MNNAVRLLPLVLAFAAAAAPAQQFQPVPAPAEGRSSQPAKPLAGRAERTHAVRGGPVRGDDPARYAALRKLLSSPPPPGTNLVISSHGNPFYAVAGEPYLAEGEAAVVRPLGSDFEVVARMRHDAWRALRP